MNGQSSAVHNGSRIMIFRIAGTSARLRCCY